jgi:hypothetical protein
MKHIITLTLALVMASHAQAQTTNCNETGYGSWSCTTQRPSGGLNPYSWQEGAERAARQNMDAQRMADEHAERLQRMEQRRQQEMDYRQYQSERERQERVEIERLRALRQEREARRIEWEQRVFPGTLQSRKDNKYTAQCLYTGQGGTVFLIGDIFVKTLEIPVDIKKPCPTVVWFNGKGEFVK